MSCPYRGDLVPGWLMESLSVAYVSRVGTFAALHVSRLSDRHCRTEPPASWALQRDVRMLAQPKMRSLRRCQCPQSGRVVCLRTPCCRGTPHSCTWACKLAEQAMLGGRFCNRPELQRHRAGSPADHDTPAAAMHTRLVPIAALMRMEGIGGEDGDLLAYIINRHCERRQIETHSGLMMQTAP